MTTTSPQPSARGRDTVVQVADMRVATGPSGRVVTYALGSCIGLVAYDPTLKLGGMLHFMLPQPGKLDAGKADRLNMFASTGIPQLLSSMEEKGALRPRMKLVAAGGAEVIDDSGRFAIGSRNRTMLRKLLWKENLRLEAEDTGGKSARTLTLDLDTGRVLVRSAGKEVVLWPRN